MQNSSFPGFPACFCYVTLPWSIYWLIPQCIFLTNFILTSYLLFQDAWIICYAFDSVYFFYTIIFTGCPSLSLLRLKNFFGPLIESLNAQHYLDHWHYCAFVVLQYWQIYKYLTFSTESKPFVSECSCTYFNFQFCFLTEYKIMHDRNWMSERWNLDTK